MIRHLIALFSFLALLPSPPGGVVENHDIPGAEVSATLVTEPGQRFSQEAAFQPGPDGRVRVIVLLDGDARLLGDLGSGAEVHHRFTRLIDGLALSVTPDGLDILRSRPGVRAVYPDTLVHAALDDSVPLVGAPQLWAMTDGLGLPVVGTGIRVAILDTGVDYTHPALGGCLGPGCKVIGGYDFVHLDGDPMDDHGHGTHVAGIVAASGLSTGVAPGAGLLAYKVLRDDGVGYASDVIAGLEQAVADGADVINLSLSAPGSPDDPVSLAAQAAMDAGSVVVAAAGNEGPRAGTVEAPSIAPGVISVAASDKADIPADFSGRGPVAGTYALKPDLIAPGVQIRSTVPPAGPLSDPSGWAPANGTSMATPHVAGGAALLRQLHPAWTPAEVKAALMNHALDLGVDLFVQGAGRLDLPPTAEPELLAVPGSLSFGLPLLEGTQVLTLSVRNLSDTALHVTPTVTVAQVTDGAGQPLGTALPMGYAAITPAGLALAPGASHLVTVTLDIPFTAADGYYQGRVRLETPGPSDPVRVPVAFSLLSRVTVHVLDEAGVEINGWGHMAVLARIPEADVVVSNVPLQIPATFTVPSGDYYAQAFGRFGIYDDLLVPGLLPQVPYVVVQAMSVEPHASQSIVLGLASTRPYWLDATDLEGNPAFINAWAASLRYQQGEATWLTRLGQSYVRVLSTSLPPDWRTGFPLRLSDTPPGVTFGLALQEASFSPLYRDFMLRHGSTWPAAPSGGFGFPLVGSADRESLLSWERPGLDASTTPTFTTTAAEVVTYDVRTDLPGALQPAWLGWEPSGGSWLYPPNGARSSLEPVAPGLRRTLTVKGAHHTVFWAGPPADYRLFHRPFYGVDWSQTEPWTGDPDVQIPDAAALQPLSPGQGALTIGAGPLFPALAFDNEPDAVQLRHPLLAGATGSAVAWGAQDPAYALLLDGTPVVTGTLPEYDRIPSPARRWPGLSPGAYGLVVTPTVNLAASQGDLGPSPIRAGFHLAASPGADLNPPQVLDFALPQRFDPDRALTVTWTLSDATPTALAAAVRLGSGSWEPLAIDSLGGDRFQTRVEPGGLPTLTLAYTATDAAGNWLAWQAGGGATSLAQMAANLSFELDPPHVPWGHQPVSVRITGSLRDAAGQPLTGAPVWLRLQAGQHLAGYVRDLTGSPGSYQTGIIDFLWTFVPSQLTPAPGTVPVLLAFDAGLYTPQAVTHTLELVPPLYLPLIFNRAEP